MFYFKDFTIGIIADEYIRMKEYNPARILRGKYNFHQTKTMRVCE